jgi:hypothetical protein
MKRQSRGNEAAIKRQLSGNQESINEAATEFGKNVKNKFGNKGEW